MSLKLIDNFNVRIKKPLDDREVCQNYSEIDTPYEGLITLQKSDGKRYEYKDNAWKEYFSSGGIDDLIDVTKHGVKGDGTNETSIIQSLLNTYTKLYFPKGTYKFDSLIIPSTVKEFRGSGDETIFTNFSTPLTSSLLTFDRLINAKICDFTMNNNNTTNPNATHIVLSSLNNCIIENINILYSAYVGISGYDCNKTTVRNCNISNWLHIAIYFAGTNSKYNLITNNVVSGNGDLHAIQCERGHHNKITNNIVTGAGQFGCNLYLENNSHIKNNQILNTSKEGINIEDSDFCTVSENDVKWTKPINSIDFGISLYGSTETTTVNNCIIYNNIVTNPAKSGIALAENCSYNLITNNIIINPNQINEDWGSGVLVYGYVYAPKYNTISDNKIINNESTDYLKYGVSEQRQPTVCLADYNIFKHNDSFGAIKSCILANFRSYSLLNNPEVWLDCIPVVTTSVGTIASHSIIKAQYKMEGKKCHIYFQIKINDNGTGEGTLFLSLPYEQSDVLYGRCNFNGHEVGNTGWLLSGSLYDNKVAVRNYANQYVGGNNAIIILEGYYEILNV